MARLFGLLYARGRLLVYSAILARIFGNSRAQTAEQSFSARQRFLCCGERFTDAVARPSSLVRVVYYWRVPRDYLWVRNALNAAFEAHALLS